MNYDELRRTAMNCDELHQFHTDMIARTIGDESVITIMKSMMSGLSASPKYLNIVRTRQK